MVRNIILALVAVAILGLVWAAVALYQPAEPDEPAERTQHGMEPLWLQAVIEDRAEDAIALAEAIVPPSDRPAPNPAYVKLAGSAGVSAAFLSGAFNQWDYQVWRDALFFQTEARRATRDQSDDVDALVRALRAAVKPKSAAADVIPWPRNIWQHGRGLSDRMVWIACELAYQLGYEAQVVYMRSPDGAHSPHTICELRARNGRVWFVDPYFGVALSGTSVEQVAREPDTAKSIWPDREPLQAGVRNCKFFTAAYPSDYCPRNQVLAARLREALGEACPRFGEDPIVRGRAYRTLWVEESGAEPSFPMGIWVYPFAVLHGQMAREMGLDQAADSP